MYSVFAGDRITTPRRGRPGALERIAAVGQLQRRERGERAQRLDEERQVRGRGGQRARAQPCEERERAVVGEAGDPRGGGRRTAHCLTAWCLAARVGFEHEHAVAGEEGGPVERHLLAVATQDGFETNTVEARGRIGGQWSAAAVEEGQTERGQPERRAPRRPVVPLERGRLLVLRRPAQAAAPCLAEEGERGLERAVAEEEAGRHRLGRRVAVGGGGEGFLARAEQHVHDRAVARVGRGRPDVTAEPEGDGSLPAAAVLAPPLGGDLDGERAACARRLEVDDVGETPVVGPHRAWGGRGSASERRHRLRDGLQLVLPLPPGTPQARGRRATLRRSAVRPARHAPDGGRVPGGLPRQQRCLVGRDEDGPDVLARRAVLVGVGTVAGRGKAAVVDPELDVVRYGAVHGRLHAVVGGHLDLDPSLGGVGLAPRPYGAREAGADGSRYHAGSPAAGSAK